MNKKISAPMQSQTNDMITEFGPHDLHLRSSPRGDLHYHNLVFYVYLNNVYTSQCRFSTLTDQRHSSQSVFQFTENFTTHSVFQLTENLTITHNVTNINLFSTIDENSMKHNSMLQSLTTLIYYVCKYNKLMWVCVTMR